MPDLRDLKLALDSRPAEVKNLARLLRESGAAADALSDVLKGGLRSASARTRAAAVAALGGLAVPRAWDALVQALQDPDPALRSEALRSLAGADDEGAVARLAAAAGHADAALRRDALAALAGRTGPERDDALRELLRAEDPWTRRSALEALATAGFAAVREHVAVAVRDGHPSVRTAAARLAAAAGDRDALELLLAGADDPDREVARISRQRLEAVSLAPSEALEIAGRLPPQRGGQARGVLSRLLATAATADLVSRLGRHGPIADALVLETVAGRGPEGREALDPILRGRDAARAAAAIEALLAIATPELFASLVDQWESLHRDVRRMLVERAASGGESWTDPALVRGSSEADAEIAGPAMRAVAARGRYDLMTGPRLLEALAQAIDGAGWTESAREKLAREAAKAGPSAIPLLARGAAAKSAGLRRASAQSLVALKALDALAKLGESEDPTVLRLSALALGQSADPRGLLPLVRVLEEGHGEWPRKAKKLLGAYAERLTVDTFLEWAGHRRASIRRHAVERLAGSGDSRAAPALLVASGDSAVDVQLAAVLGLKAFVDRDAVVDRLLECTRGADLAVRQAAVEALGEGRVARAVPDLVRLLGNPLLRSRAEDALRRIGDRQGTLAVLRRKRRDENIRKQRDDIAARNARGGRNLSGPGKRKKIF